MKTYMTFETFNEEEYREFINDLSKETLLKILKVIPKYKNNPLIKNFRDSKIDDKFIRNLYIKEYQEGKTQLEDHLLVLVDKTIKKELSQDEYFLLKNKTYDDETFEFIALKLLNKSKIKSKYIKKLFNLNNNIINRYESDKKNKEVIKEFQQRENELKEQVDELNKTVDNLKQHNEELINKTKQLESEIEKYKLTNNEKNQNKPLDNKKIKLEDILLFLKNDIYEIEYNTLLELFKSYNLYELELCDLLDRLTSIKKEFLNKKNFESIKNILLLEYILIKIKEITNNE